MAGSPTSPSRCRVSAPAPSRSSVRRRSGESLHRARVAGQAIAAFALSEPDAGSDVAGSRRPPARRRRLRPRRRKTWISNGGIADPYVVVRPHRRGARRQRPLGLSGRRRHAGLSIAERIEVIAPHPLARIEFENCRVPADRRDRRAGRRLQDRDGDARRVPLHGRRGGARLRPARARRGGRACPHAPAVRRAAGRAADGAGAHRRHGARRRRGGAPRLSRGLDQGQRRRARHARGSDGEALRHRGAQRVIDNAVQLHGGLGVRRGHIVERLYREIRALRIYEGASEVQKVVIARQTLGG